MTFTAAPRLVIGVWERPTEGLLRIFRFKFAWERSLGAEPYRIEWGVVWYKYAEESRPRLRFFRRYRFLQGF